MYDVLQGGGVPPASNSRMPPLPHEPAGFYNDRAATVDIPLGSSKELKRREEAAARVQYFTTLPLNVILSSFSFAAGIVIETKNWPPFMPIIHHDISNEIPIHLQRMQYLAFCSLLGLTLCLFWNIIATTAAWIKGAGVVIWLLAIIYFISGVPGAYVLWYRPLYNAMSGFLPAIDVIGSNVIVGIFYFVGFGLFCLEALLSIVVIQQVYMYFRGSGKAAQMRQEAARGAMRSAF
ncbi:unnamed protein product [Triticum turgidum subsp. durum]|uniref:Secretory carrier-associated membrane protein n=1 Tax=Triticum turgidum subsp. durum TaxID=4567 RepID=A0A9R1QQL4_TRITD|nr:unnamed protein product [Triticum turgidum subsp. durum]